tara:strand:- start:389 stop:541 length:153 start_codon:yes stop_codon:yes gene_type:complete
VQVQQLKEVILVFSLSHQVVVEVEVMQLVIQIWMVVLVVEVYADTLEKVD